MLQRSDSIKNYFKRSFKILFVTLTSLILAFFLGSLFVAADSEDTPRPGIDKANEKNNVKPGGSNNHSNTEFDWEEIQGGSPGSGGDGEKDGSGGHTSNPPGGEEGGTGDDTSTPPGDNEGGTGDDTSTPGGEEGDIGDDTSTPGGEEGDTGDDTSVPGGEEGGTGNGTTSNPNGSDTGWFNNGPSSTPGWDLINGKSNPLNGIYPGYLNGLGNGDYNGMPFSAGAGALGILSPYGPGYNGFNNSSNLGKFASKNKKASMWSEMEDGVNGLNVQLGVLKKFQELNRNKNSDTKAASLAGTLIKAPFSMLNIMFDNDALDVTSDAVGFSADTVTNSYSWVQKFKETHSFKNGAG